VGNDFFVAVLGSCPPLRRSIFGGIAAMITRVPPALIVFRLVAGIALPLLAWLHTPPSALAALLVLGFLSDVFDGLLARRLGTDTLPLRRLDTRCDIVFALGAVLASLIANPSSGSQWFPWIWGYLALFLLRNAVDYLKYRASPSYHMWSGKLWSAVIYLAIFAALIGAAKPWLSTAAFCIYAINALEGIAASLVFSRPAKDIPSIWHAFRLRKSISNSDRS
jgi:phosphatidylglycerophosphate synthase